MDDESLKALLRELGRDQAEEFPEGVEARIQERMWQVVLAEETERAVERRNEPRRRWSFGAMLRPMTAAAAAAALALGVAVVSDGGPGSAGTAGSVTQAAGTTVFDATASTLFGNGPRGRSAAPIVGSIDRKDDVAGHSFVDGPSHVVTGELDAGSSQLVTTLPRDPAVLRDLVRRGVSELGIDDAGDRVAYRATMRWIVDTAVPADLRAALLRSLAGLEGIDDAQLGVDTTGRTGVVIGHLDYGSSVRTQAILDRATGALLEVRSFTTAYVDPACPPGTFTERETFSDGHRVDPSSMPWVDWPMVVAACAGASTLPR